MFSMWFTTQALEPTHSEHFPACNKSMSTVLSEPEWRFLQIEVLMGQFHGPSEAIRHYVRRGLQAEGKFTDAIRCG
jgi:hypothetical protein